jgi:putative inorganic carbon (HCO3(-)) transporter
MRDILIVILFSLGLLRAFKEPIYGVLVWSWIAYMSPHRLGWGFAYSLPYAMISAVVAIPLAFAAKEKRSPFSASTVLLCCLVLWMAITTMAAIFPEDAWVEYKRFLKVVLMTLISGMLLVNKGSIDKLLIVIVGSLGFYGVKGGLFTILTGGSFRVWGPAGSFVEGNNEIALALLMIIPLMNYFRIQTSYRWIKNALIAAMVLSGVAAIGSQSRGALLATGSMLVWFWFKSKNKGLVAIGVGVIAAVVLAMMPDSWFHRMETIENYEADSSAMGRINAWWLAWNIARDRLTAGGFNHWSSLTYSLYAPNPKDVHDVHSIYFEIIGEHGFIGFGIYMLIWLIVARDTLWIIKNTKNSEPLNWACDLAKMSQVTFIAYATGGAFLGLAYFDLPWALVMIVAATKKIVKEQLALGVPVPLETHVDLGNPRIKNVFTRSAARNRGSFT